MTSKNLCFKLMKEDLKHRIWAVALLVLSFFFGVVIPVVLQFGDTVESRKQWIAVTSASVIELLGIGNPFVFMILIPFALICAISGFSYLHSSKKVDLYHSLPVKRSSLFWAHYLNGILMTAVIYLAALLISMVIAATAGIGFDVTLFAAIRAYAFHMAYFGLLYTTMVVAMIMTGNIIIALLSNTVFCFYGPSVVLLISIYVSLWFETYSRESVFLGNDFFQRIIENTSPFINYMAQLDMFEYGNITMVKKLSSVVLITGLLAVISWLFYGKRPSEAAGKAMAFKRTMTPIKILLVIPVALAFGLFFWGIGVTMGWAVFGLISGALLVHCLIEIIYHFDFRKLFCHKVHLVICIVGALICFCGFKYDWFGYDSYLPEGDQVLSASIEMEDMDQWVSYGSVHKRIDSEGKDYYSWEYKSSIEYIREHMKITDIADILSIAQKGIQNASSDRSGGYSNGRWSDRFTISYSLNNGRKVFRRYFVSKEQVQEEVERIFDSSEYKTGIYPLLSQKAEDTARINFQQYDDITEVNTGGDSKNVAELLAAYQEDLLGLTMDTARQEMPIATIQFVTQDMDEVLSKDKKELNDNEYRYQVHDIADRCYYPIYPSFSRTIKLLEESGITISRGLPVDHITNIDIPKYYTRGSADEEMIREAMTITDRAQIEALVPALIYEDYYYMNPATESQQRYNEGISVYVNSGTEERIITCHLNLAKIPDFLKNY